MDLKSRLYSPLDIGDGNDPVDWRGKLRHLDYVQG
jgi:hypothetical protein